LSITGTSDWRFHEGGFRYSKSSSLDELLPTSNAAMIESLPEINYNKSLTIYRLHLHHVNTTPTPTTDYGTDYNLLFHHDQPTKSNKELY